MASRIFSIRLDDRVVEALEALQLPDDDSLNTTLKRFVIEGLGIDVSTPVNIVNNDERLKELVDNKTAYLADAMNEVKDSLEAEIEALKQSLKKEIKALKALRARVDDLTPATAVSASPTAMPTAVNYTDKATNTRPTCPHCKSTISIGNGKDRHGLSRYKCKNCGKTFSE